MGYPIGYKTFYPKASIRIDRILPKQQFYVKMGPQPPLFTLSRVALQFKMQYTSFHSLELFSWVRFRKIAFVCFDCCYGFDVSSSKFCCMWQVTSAIDFLFSWLCKQALKCQSTKSNFFSILVAMNDHANTFEDGVKGERIAGSLVALKINCKFRRPCTIIST